MIPRQLPRANPVNVLGVAVALLIALVGAFSTLGVTAPLVNKPIVAGQLVPLGAVCLKRIDRGRTYASKDILPVRDRLKVVRIDASRIPAKVVKWLPAGYWSLVPFVRSSVGANDLPGSAISHGSVAKTLGFDPCPASGILINNHARIELVVNSFIHATKIL